MTSLATDRRKLRETNVLLVGGFLFLLGANFITWFPKDLFGRGLQDWVYTEWLVDYSAGFVRRGLSGQVLYPLAHFVRPLILVGCLGWMILGGLTLAYLRAVWRSLDRLHPVLVVGLLFLPSLLPFYLYDHGAFARKETLGLLILAWHLRALEVRGSGPARPYFPRAVLPVMIALPIHALIHESSFLLFVPVHGLLSERVLRREHPASLPGRCRTLALLYAPVTLAFAAAVLFGRPTFAMALTIYQHWVAVGGLAPGAYTAPGQDPTWALPGALTGLPWSFSQALSLTLSLTGQDIVDWLVSFSILGWATVWVGRRVVEATLTDGTAALFAPGTLRSRNTRRFGWKYFALPFLCSTPLYLVGWDFGRWFAVTCLCYTLVVLSPEAVRAELPPEEFSTAESTKNPNPGAATALPTRFYLGLFAFLAVVLCFRLPHCCIEGFNMLAEPLNYLFENVMHVLKL